MRSKPVLFACLMVLAATACTSTATEMKADDVIAIAKTICRGKAKPSVAWRTEVGDGVWAAIQPVGDYAAWVVLVPITGQSKTRCIPRSGPNSEADCRCEPRATSVAL